MIFVSLLLLLLLLLLYCPVSIQYTNGCHDNTTTTSLSSKVATTSTSFHQQQQQYQYQQQRVLQQQGQQSCNICPNDNEELIPNAAYEFLFLPYKCSDTLNITVGGCLIRQEYVRTICCRTKSDNPNPSIPGPVPVPSPTEPVPVPVVLSNTASPASVPSLTDFPKPYNDFDEFRTQGPFDIFTTTTPPPQMIFNSEASTNILIRMESAPSALNTPQLISKFEFVIGSILDNSVIALLWRESFNSITKVVVNVTVTSQRSTATTPIQQQQKQQSTSNRMRRIQQSQSLFLVNNVITNVDGLFTNTGNAAVVVPTDIWRKVILQAINDNERTFVEALYKSNSVYYSSLSTVFISSVDDDTGTNNSTITSTTTSSSTISTSAVIGIVIGIITVLVIIVLFVIRNNYRKNNHSNNDTATNTTDNNNNKTPTNTISLEKNNTKIDVDAVAETTITTTTTSTTMKKKSTLMDSTNENSKSMLPTAVTTTITEQLSENDIISAITDDVTQNDPVNKHFAFILPNALRTTNNMQQSDHDNDDDDDDNVSGITDDITSNASGYTVPTKTTISTDKSTDIPLVTGSIVSDSNSTSTTSGINNTPIVSNTLLGYSMIMMMILLLMMKK